MFPEGQRVEFLVGSFAGQEGIVVSREDALQCNLPNADLPPRSEDEVLVLVTFWGRELLVPVTPDQIQAI